MMMGTAVMMMLDMVVMMNSKTGRARVSSINRNCHRRNWRLGLSNMMSGFSILVDFEETNQLESEMNILRDLSVAPTLTFTSRHMYISGS